MLYNSTAGVLFHFVGLGFLPRDLQYERLCSYLIFKGQGELLLVYCGD